MSLVFMDSVGLLALWSENAIAANPACVQLTRDFIKAKPELWNEDVGI
jgi:hypothetical protein